MRPTDLQIQNVLVYILVTLIWHIPLFWEKKAPVCVACNTVITVKHILIECADLLEIRKKYCEEKYLYSLFRNVIPEIIFDFLLEIGVFYKIWSVSR